MKRNLFYTIIAAALITGACKKSQDINRDYAIPTGKGSYPVSSNALVDLSTNKTLGTDSLKAGYMVTTELQYFSQDPVKEINLYNTVGNGARTKIPTQPYAAAYSNIKKLDTLLIPYTVPTGLSQGTKIKLEYEIVNQNALNLVRTYTITTKL